MKISFIQVASHTSTDDLVFLIDNKVILDKLPLQKEEIRFTRSEIGKGVSQVILNRFTHRIFIVTEKIYSRKLSI